jgi:DNA-binding IclR family transcriptional regulator
MFDYRSCWTIVEQKVRGLPLIVKTGHTRSAVPYVRHPRRGRRATGVVTPGGETSQTLDRGLTALTLLAENEDGLTAADIADRIGTARAAVYRLLRTLEIHNLVSHEGPRYFLGFGIADLAGRLKPRLRATVLPILRKLSEQTNSTALLSVTDGDQALILVTAEPPRATFHIALREGSRHPLDVGADGVAILAGRPASATDTDEVRLARRRGYAVTVGALQTGAVGIAAPILVSDRATASVGVVQLGVEVDDALVPAVMNAAAEAAARLSVTSRPEAAEG